MEFKELNFKGTYSNKYGKSAYIDRYVHYAGTKQISIYIKTGYGASEQTFNEVIDEKDLLKWVDKFKTSVNLPTSNPKPSLSHNKPSVNLPKKENMINENEKLDNPNNFDSMREILFESMRMVKAGNLDIEKAKTISTIGQTIINSVKVEIDFLKLTGSKEKPKMID